MELESSTKHQNMMGNLRIVGEERGERVMLKPIEWSSTTIRIKTLPRNFGVGKKGIKRKMILPNTEKGKKNVQSHRGIIF